MHKHRLIGKTEIVKKNKLDSTRAIYNIILFMSLTVHKSFDCNNLGTFSSWYVFFIDEMVYDRVSFKFFTFIFVLSTNQNDAMYIDHILKQKGRQSDLYAVLLL